MDILTSIETVMDSDLLHYGRPGMKWGVRNGPPYPLHPEQLSSAEKKARRSVFISGSSKTQFEDSGYYRKELPKAIQNKIDDYIKDHAHIIVGDAPGIDRQVQDYLNEKGYDAVEIYGPGKQVRYAANDKWKTNPVDAPEFEEMSPEWLRKKDIAMTNDATEGLAIVLDDGAQATRNNVARLREQGKQAEVFILGKDGEDDWEANPGTYEQMHKYLDRIDFPEAYSYLFDSYGKLTSAGRKAIEHYFEKIPNEHERSGVDYAFENGGITKVKDGYELQENGHIRRVASENEPLDSRRKYASVTRNDAILYDQWYHEGELDTKTDTPSYTYEYSAKPKFKIADEAAVVSYVADAYGSADSKYNAEIYSKYLTGRLSPKEYSTGEDTYRDALFDHALSIVHDVQQEFKRANGIRGRSDAVNKGKTSLYKHFSKLGYDAIVDVEDYMRDAELPIIVLNPKESLTVKKAGRWTDYSLFDAYDEYKKSLSHSDFLSAVELVLPDDALQYGVLGQKWGIRKWQNKDGTLTPAGRERWINSLKQEAYAASKKWEEYQQVRKQVINMHYEGKFDNELETKMLRLKEEANEAGAVWGSLRKRIESYLENGPDVSTSEPVEDAPHKILIPVTDEEKYKHYLDLGYVEKGRNDTWIYMVNHKKYVKHSDTNQNDVLTAIETVMDGDIEHSGRKGQKWGIRNGPPYPLRPEQLSARERMLDDSGKNIAATGERKAWQKSGTLSEIAKVPYTGLSGNKLTKLGRKHLEQMVSQEAVQDWARRTEQSKARSLKKAGVKSSKDGGYVLDNTGTLHRVADASDKVDTHRKYVSVTDRDSKYYEDTFKKGFLGVQDRDKAAAFKYKGKKELRIADADDVMTYIVNTYGGRKEQQLYKDVKETMAYRDVFKELSRSGLGSAADVAVAKYLTEFATTDLRSFVKSQLWNGASETGKKVYADNKQAEILGHYRDLGYDAITDVEDYLGGMDLPVIVIDPSQSIKVKSKSRLSHGEEFLVHSGRKGQKWGIRNGPPYPLDPEQFSSAEKAAESARSSSTLYKSGIRRRNKHTDIISRGTKFVRQAAKNDDRYHDRKYMSVTESDIDYYRNEYGEPAEYVYEAKRDLKVANADAVIDYIVNDMLNYNNSKEGKQLSALYGKYLMTKDSKREFTEAENKERYEFMSKVVSKQRAKYGRESDNEFDTHRQILKHFSDVGYDAIVDINQSWQGMEYPVIVIDPDDSTKLKTKIVHRFFLKDKVVNY